ncbi:MAG: AMP-binding protein [Bacteroidota bacterium]
MKTAYTLYNVPEITSVQNMIVKSAAKFGDKIALEDLKETPIPKVTYRSLLKNILKFGIALENLGLKERSHIAVVGENRVQWGIAYLSAMCFNHVVVPIDRNLPINEVLNIIHEADVAAIIFSDTFDSVLRERKASMKKLKYYIGMDLPAAKEGFYSMRELIEASPGCRVEDLPTIDPREEAEIIFTSGSLGRAKGVMLSQKNIASNLVAMVEMFFIYPEDRFLSVLPMHHTYECTCGFLCPLYAGASAHYARSLKTVVEDLQSVKATMLLGVPLLFDKMFKRIYRTIHEKKVTSLLIGPLIKVSDVVERVGWKSFKKIVFKEIHHRFGGSIRCFVAGGAAQDPVVAKGLREFGFNFVQGYGLTETSPLLALNQLDKFKDDAAGLPLASVELIIHEPDSEGVGEVWARGANVMLGYYKNESATGDAFEDGWFKTGDLGRLDEEGFLHISGRKKNVIISKSGKNVFPEEVEDVLNRSPFVLESYVYGEEDAKLDEIIAAQIVVDAEAFIELSEMKSVKITPELLHEVIAGEVKKTNMELPNYKQIKKFKIRDQEFEKTTTQKIKRYLVGRN